MSSSMKQVGAFGRRDGSNPLLLVTYTLISTRIWVPSFSAHASAKWRRRAEPVSQIDGRQPTTWARNREACWFQDQPKTNSRARLTRNCKRERLSWHLNGESSNVNVVVVCYKLLTWRKAIPATQCEASLALGLSPAPRAMAHIPTISARVDVPYSVPHIKEQVGERENIVAFGPKTKVAWLTVTHVHVHRICIHVSSTMAWNLAGFFRWKQLHCYQKHTGERDDDMIVYSSAWP